MRSRKWAKRREMGFIPLMANPFPKEIKVTYHHLNDKPGLSIPLPTIIHSNIPGNPVKLHRKLVDGWIKKLYCIDIDTLIKHCQSRQVDNTFK